MKYFLLLVSFLLLVETHGSKKFDEDPTHAQIPTINLSDSVYLKEIEVLTEIWLQNESLSWEVRNNKIDSLGIIYRDKFGIHSLSYSLITHKKGVYDFYHGWEGDVSAYMDANRHYKNALDIRTYIFENTRFNLRDDILKGYNNISSNYLRLGQTHLAADFVKSGFRFFDKTGSQDVSVIYALHSTAARTYLQLGDYDNTINHYESIIENPGIAVQDKLTALNSLAGLYGNQLYDPESALKVLSKTEEILNDGSYDISHFADYNRNKGITYIRLHDFDSALHYFRESLKLNQKAKSYLYMADDCNNIAVALNELSRPDSAEIYLKKARELYEAIGLEYNLTLVYDNAADAAFIKGDYLKSLHYHNLGLSLLIPGFEVNDAFSSPEVVDKVLVNKANISYILNSKTKTLLHIHTRDTNNDYLLAAYETITTADQVIGMMRSEFQAEASRMSLASYAKPIYEQGIEVCYLLYQLQPHDSLLEKAFEFAEKSKAIILLDAVRKTNARAHVNPELINAEKAMNLKVNYFEMQAALYEQDSSHRTSYNVYDSLLYYRRRRQEVVDQIKDATPEYYKLIFDQATIKAEEIRDNLNEEQAFIEYFLGDSSLYSFAITEDTVLFLKHDEASVIKTHAKDWLLTIPAMNQDFLFPGHELFKLLIEPLKQNIDLPEKLTLVPDDLLNLLSFEALNTEYPDEDRVYLPEFKEYLIYEHQFSYAYSASTLRETSTNDKKVKRRYLGIAPKMDQGFYQQNTWFDELKYNREEVTQAADLFPKSNLIQSSSAKDEFLQSAPDFSVIHCATHAMANNSDGDLSFISFGKDEADLIYAKDLYALDLNASLVVLSACQTSAGEHNKGEGIISLARSFTYAGASSVITSLWNVREKPNNKIIYEFYRLLLRGKTKDEALRMAKLKYISGISKANQANAHPYFWATLVVIGDTSPLLIDRSKGISVAVFVGLLVIVLFIAWRRNRESVSS